MNEKEYNEVSQRLEQLESILNGGKGSGNFGHYGRPGYVGGSADTPTHIYEAQPDGERLKARDKRFGLIYQGISKQHSVLLDSNDNPLEWGKSDGYLVRGYGKKSSISAKDFEKENERFSFVQEFEADNLGLLIQKDSVLSGWVRDGQVTFDVSKRFKDLKKATKEAAIRGQGAVVDIKGVKALDTKDLMDKYKISRDSVLKERQKIKEEKEKDKKKGEINIKVRRFTDGVNMKVKTYNELLGKIQRLEKLLNKERPDAQTIIETDQDKKYGIDVLTERIVEDKAQMEELKARISRMVGDVEGHNGQIDVLEEQLKDLEDDLREAESELRVADSKKKEEQALVENGGKGSGNFGHYGRPGLVGGSSANPILGGIIQRVDKTGGFTVSTQGEFKDLGESTGFAVGGYGTERSISAKEWKDSKKRREFITEYLQENDEVFESDPEQNYLGGWVDNGRVYLDVSRVFKSERQAAREAAKTHQDAVTDFKQASFPETKDLVKKYGLQDIWKKSAGMREAERRADEESKKAKTKREKKA